MRNVLQEPRDHFRKNMPPHAGPNQQAPYPTPFNDTRVITRSRRHARHSVIFTPTIQVHRYPPAVWGDDEEVNDDDEWDVGSYRNEDPSLAEEAALAEREPRGGGDSDGWMIWEEAFTDLSRARGPAEEQRRQQEPRAQQLQQQLQPQQEAGQQAAQQRSHQQRQLIEEQRGQQQIMAHTKAGQAAATSTQGPGQLFIRHQGAREQLVLPQDFSSSVSPSSSSTSARAVDPIDASETKMGTISLPVQRSNLGSRASPRSTGPMLPRGVMQQQEEERKQTREDIGAIEEAARNKAKLPSSGRPQRGEKLRKEPQSDDDDISRGKDKKGKSGGLFGRLLDRRKHANKEKGTNDSIDISWPIKARSSEESGRSSSHTDNSGGPQTPSPKGLALTNTSPPVSQHASSLRQRGKEQQTFELYQQQYLTRSPASPPEAPQLLQRYPVNPGQASIAYTLLPTSDGRHPRPGSLSIGGNTNGDSSSLVPELSELSVIRIFAGKKLQTEATFKIVLLNSSTSSEELVKQAIQRFRLPAREGATDYYLTIKRLEGSSAVLRPEEKPLVVFETLAEAALDLPRVKRSSVGSISSIVSNLSQHPAFKKLSMNDFTDDTAVKIYLNRRSESTSDEGGTTEGDTTTNNESIPGEGEVGLRPRPHNLSTVGVSVPSERFSSPSFRFALQLLIYPDDLPDDMIFDPLTEAIVFKNTRRDRNQAAASSAPFGRKIFMFPKNIIVAEVIEIGLERFGIPDGVVHSGGEVEDKNTKRRSSSRVHYVLNVLIDGKGG